MYYVLVTTIIYNCVPLICTACLKKKLIKNIRPAPSVLLYLTRKVFTNLFVVTWVDRWSGLSTIMWDIQTTGVRFVRQVMYSREVHLPSALLVSWHTTTTAATTTTRCPRMLTTGLNKSEHSSEQCLHETSRHHSTHVIFVTTRAVEQTIHLYTSQVWPPAVSTFPVFVSLG